MQCLQYDELRYDTTNHPDSRGVLPVKRVFTGCTVKTGFYRETYGVTCFYRMSDFMTGFTGSRQLCNGNGILDLSFLDRQSLFFGAPVKTRFYRNSQHLGVGKALRVTKTNLLKECRTCVSEPKRWLKRQVYQI